MMTRSFLTTLPFIHPLSYLVFSCSIFPSLSLFLNSVLLIIFSSFFLNHQLHPRPISEISKPSTQAPKKAQSKALLSALMIQSVFKESDLEISLDDAKRIRPKVMEGLHLLDQRKSLRKPLRQDKENTDEEEFHLLLLDLADLLYMEVNRCSGNIERLTRSLKALSKHYI